MLKQGETFAVFDRYGDIQPLGLSEQGLYHEGTRFISRMTLRLEGERPLLLSSTVRADNILLTVDLTNPDVYDESGLMVMPRDTLHISRIRFLWQRVCYERLRIRNHGLDAAHGVFSLRWDADFVDVFEVRGMKRERRGRNLEPLVADRTVTLAYQGLDRVTRRTRLEFSSPDSTEISVSGSEARLEVQLEPQAEATYLITISCETGDPPARPASYAVAFAESQSDLRAARSQTPEITTSNEQFNEWLDRSAADLLLMETKTSEGPFPYAGVPWYSTVFGRDAIITALECLWVNPLLAKGVLSYLASTQSKEIAAEQDAEPGKILHETRCGEMAALGEVPFGRYYGSVDATPLFIMLAGKYHGRTGDSDLIESIWPNIELALEWIDSCGDADGDGFVEYLQHSLTGLSNQGWKDSADPIFHADGTLAEGPIALCEVQGYVYAAKRGAARLASALGKKGMAEPLYHQAEALRERFERAFWSEELSTYAVALDGDKRPCQVRTSNAGHALFTGIATPEHAHRAMRTLSGQEMFSGWGVRTVAESEPRYNPMSYHNGSVWPHDNALVAYGLARYGFKEQALQILSGLFDASVFMDLHRLPELFCGFARRDGEGPTLYPLANSPQAWASAAVYFLLEACLGLSIRASREAHSPSQVRFSHPLLPESIGQIWVKNLQVGNASVNLSIHRYPTDVGVDVVSRDGDVEVVAVK